MTKNEIATVVAKNFFKKVDEKTGVLYNPFSSVLDTPIPFNPYDKGNDDPYEALRQRLYYVYNASGVYQGTSADGFTEERIYRDNIDTIEVCAYAWFKKPYRGRRSFGGMRIIVGEIGKAGWKMFDNITEAMDCFITMHHYICCA